ncbi:MAG TPA: PhzF family phenazine biosynthesis protein [Amycolatopsis sp.]|nr:PhzF family phenazine biosynthesis protein [Amycolatopsis sp.]
MRLYVVDAFTDKAFAGNPAGVVLLDQPAESAWMQSVAAELRHSETAFVEPGGGLRWFTPAVEVDLCGHATLAAGHALGGEQLFRTRSGELRTRAADGWVSMDFPADPPVASADEVAPALPGVTVAEVLRGKWDIVVVAADAAEVRAMRPDLDAIAGWQARCVVVTARGDKPGVDFVSRVFGPAVGIPEDPVTGSVHCTLAPFWARRLGRDELVGEQASERGGIVRVQAGRERVTLAGRAVTVLSGELLV